MINKHKYLNMKYIDYIILLNVKYRNIRMVNDQKDNPTISVLRIKENFRFNSYKLYEKEMDLSVLPPVKKSCFMC